jgi:hypothetical protein
MLVHNDLLLLFSQMPILIRHSFVTGQFISSGAIVKRIVPNDNIIMQCNTLSLIHFTLPIILAVKKLSIEEK